MAYTIDELSKNYEDLLQRVASLEEKVERIAEQTGSVDIDDEGNMTYE